MPYSTKSALSTLVGSIPIRSVIALALTGPLAFALPAQAGIVYRENFEKYSSGTTSIPGWNFQTCKNGGRSRCGGGTSKPIEVTSSTAREGNKSLKFTMRRGDKWYEGGSGKLKSRNEIRRNLPGTNRGDEIWIGYSFKPMSPWKLQPGDHQTVTQFMNNRTRTHLRQILKLYENGTVSFNGVGTLGQVRWNQWNDVVFRFVNGRSIDVWFNGRKKSSRWSVYNANDGSDLINEIKIGNYAHDPEGSTAITTYYDELTIATGSSQLAAVAPGGSPPPPSSPPDSPPPSSSGNIPRDGSSIVFRSKENGRLVAALNSSDRLTAEGNSIGSEDIYEIERHSGNIVSLENLRTGRFVSVDGNGYLVANATSPVESTRFEWISHSGREFSLRSQSNNRLVSSWNGNQFNLKAEGKGLGREDIYTWSPQ